MSLSITKSTPPPPPKLSDKLKSSSKRLLYTICTLILTSRSSEVRIRHTIVFPRLSFSVKREAEFNTLLEHKPSKLIIMWVIRLYSAEKLMGISKLYSPLATTRYITSALMQTLESHRVHLRWTCCLVLTANSYYFPNSINPSLFINESSLCVYCEVQTRLLMSVTWE